MSCSKVCFFFFFNEIISSISASSIDQNNTNAQHIELSSNYVTVHQVSEEETSEEKKTESLKDSSEFGAGGTVTVSKTNDGTSERAQNLEISDSNNPNVNEKITSTECNSHINNEAIDLKAPCSSEPTKENMEALQTSRLKRSFEWGNLQDAICDGMVCLDNQIVNKKISSSSMDMLSEVLAAAERFDYETNDIQLSDDDLSKFEFEFSKTIDSNATKSYDKLLAQRMKDTPASFTILQKSNDLLDAHEEIAMQKVCVETEMPQPAANTQSVNIQSIDDKSPKALSSEIRDMDNVTEITSINTNSLSEKIHEIDLGVDAKVSQYTLSNIERPKSEVLKKLILQQSPQEDFEHSQKYVDDTSFLPDVSTTQLMGEKVVDITEMEPINLMVSARSERNMKESQASPIFSSDFQGVSNISISSTESNSFNEQQLSTSFKNSENDSFVVGADISQPPQITMEDEQINSKIQTVNDVAETDSIVLFKPSLENEVFIVESLSSKKLQDSLLPVSNGNSYSKSPPRGFVTETSFPSSNKDKQMNEKNFSKSIEAQNDDYNSMKNSTPISNTNCKFESPSVIVQEDYIPRNSEIRFTTSTYQSTRQFETRSSQIDQIRSNFERSHTSEIPTPMRKMNPSSTPPPSSHSVNMARVSPSKIPVFTSQKSSDNLRNNGNMNPVSITSIKNSSRNPSGK